MRHELEIFEAHDAKELRRLVFLYLGKLNKDDRVVSSNYQVINNPSDSKLLYSAMVVVAKKLVSIS